MYYTMYYNILHHTMIYYHILQHTILNENILGYTIIFHNILAGLASVVANITSRRVHVSGRH